MNLETLLVSLYVLVDEWWQNEHPPVPRRLGRRTRLSEAEVLTLAILSQWPRFLRRERREINDATSTELVSLLQEINDLYLLGTVFENLSWPARSGNIIPAIVEVIGVGKVLHELMELQHIPDEELELLITLLQ